jgi:hypothetical protein
VSFRHIRCTRDPKRVDSATSFFAHVIQVEPGVYKVFSRRSHEGLPERFQLNNCRTLLLSRRRQMTTQGGNSRPGSILGGAPSRRRRPFAIIGRLRCPPAIVRLTPSVMEQGEHVFRRVALATGLRYPAPDR